MENHTQYHRKNQWKPVSRANPCPACGGADRCGVGDGGAVSCFRVNTPPAGMRLIVERGGAAIFKPDNGNGSPMHSPRRPTATPAPGPNWKTEHEAARAKMTADRLTELASALGVTTAALEAVGVGWNERADLNRRHASGAGWNENAPDGAFVFPERDGNARIVGLSFRAPDGRKGSPRGAKRGLTIPANFHSLPDPVLVVEGASDVAALTTLGLTGVGRPSNSGGGDMLAALRDSREVLILGENDAKESGEWPGRAGAKAVALRLASARGEPVAFALPPAESKDVRAWLNSRVAEGLNLADAEACRAAGIELLAAVKASVREVKPERKPNQSELLVRLALERFQLGVTTDGDSFAVEIGGANLAIMFRGSRDALRATLARDFRGQYGGTPKAAALADALLALAGEASDSQAEAVFLRVAEHDGAIVIDLGRKDGQAVVVRADGWHVCERSPVLFRRTALTGELPIPKKDGSLLEARANELRELLNVTDESWPLLLGWLVAAFFPNIPHPILLLGGEQGAGKTTAARLVMRCFDPGPALVRSAPKDMEQWQITASGSWGVTLDNVSRIPDWLSDTLCRAVTGDGAPRRTMYTDSEITVIAFRRVIALTSIDAGALRGDLGERLILADLERIDERARRTERELESLFAERHGRILGALLDVLAATLRELETIRLERMPRMADFARVLAAMDRAIKTDALARYIAQGRRVASDVVEGDAVGAAVEALVRERGEWVGTAGKLLAELSPEKPDRAWPKTPEGMARRIRRLAAALRAIGVEIIPPGPKDKSREYVLKLTAQTAQLPGNCPDGPENGDSARAVDRAVQGTGDGNSPNCPENCPNENAPDAIENADLGGSGGSGDCFPALTPPTGRKGAFS